MAIAEGIAATKAGFDLVRRALELVKREDLNREEISARLLELQGLLLETRQALSDSADENKTLLAKNADLQRYADIGNQFTFSEGVFWHEDYPYCPNCWQIDRKPVRLDGPSGIANTEFRCPIHKSIYISQKYEREIAF